jgi:hypothetical protein
MARKVVWGLVVLALVGILVAGAVVHTAAKTGDGAETLGRGYGDGSGTGQAQVDEWLALEGSVVSADADALVVQTDEGEEIVVENRPWSFAQEQGFVAQPGDLVTLTAFYEDGSVEVGEIANASNGQTVRIRDENGRPMWAGRGRRSG